MRVPLSWLKEYVDILVPVDELARRLTMGGVEVGDVEVTGGWTNCFVGRVTAVEPHPNADRLTLCTVDIGAEEMRVVCGAPNVAQGQRIAFAKVGANLFNTHSGKSEPLKAARIRGVVSEGMICSERELEIGEDHDGILVLPEDAPVGTPLSDYMGDQVLDLELTPNRADCLSVLGVAHEVAALTGAAVHEADISYPEEGGPIEDMVAVEVPGSDLCPRYTGSLITGVKIGPSPQWLQDRLLKAGMRPINNVVDVTNYVMLEYNQPLHAFDYDTLGDRKVVVRQARPGEVLVTLDGAERKLAETMLVIADARDAVGLGGVIGGARSEMTAGTTAVFLESATFDPTNNRRTAQTLGLSTEATLRFEKGLRPELAPIALRRATQLILQVAGGTAARGIIDVFPARDRSANPTVTLTMGRLLKVLGVDLPQERVESVFSSLGLAWQRTSEPGTGPAIQVQVPYWRNDINLEDDLVEEVARIVGYDEIPTTMLSTPIPLSQPQPLRELKERVNDLLVGCGMQEIITYTVTSMDQLERSRALEDNPVPLKLANPMSSEQEYLRTTLLGGLLSVLAANRQHEPGPIGIYEAGRVYLPREGDLPEEREMVAGVLSGPLPNPQGGSMDPYLGFFDAKGTVESLLGELGVAAGFESGLVPAMHPGRCARVAAQGLVLGTVGEVHPAVVREFGLEEGPVAVFELNLANLLQVLPVRQQRYKPVGRYPSAIRDLAVVLDLDVPAGKVREIIGKQPLVSRLSLFDVYVGDGISTGKRSLAYHIHFQAADRTLGAEEVSRALQAILRSLEREVGAELRS